MKVNINNNVNPVFSATNLHILDGGNHGKEVKNFADAVFRNSNKDIDIKFHNVLTNTTYPSLKQLSDLENVLKELNKSDRVKKGDYLAIPGLASVALANLNERIDNILHQKVSLYPSSVKENKEKLLQMLKEIYYNRYNPYTQQARYMDSAGIQMEYIWGIIQEINALVQKGVKVYIPAGHPEDNCAKDRARKCGKMNEFYRGIAFPHTSYKNDTENIINEIKQKNWYDLNLMALSNARVVNVLGTDGLPYFFAAHDDLVNDGARGVYNFCPIRDVNGKVVGYSFQDEATVECKYEDFFENDKVANLNKFVGLPLRDVTANYKEHKAFRNAVRKGKNTAYMPDKLYKITDIYDEQQIVGQKLNYLGGYINKDQKLVFDVNSKDKVLFQKCNCEGSERPSVRAVWGSCFATINAIKRDVEATSLPIDMIASIVATLPFGLMSGLHLMSCAIPGTIKKILSKK